MALKDVISEPSKRPIVVDDCVRLIDEEVKGKGGLSGVAVKGAFTVVKAIKPGIIRKAADRLLDPFDGFLRIRKTEVANALLGVTDDLAARADNQALKKAYKKLRPKAVGHVESAVPGIARIIEKHAP